MLVTAALLLLSTPAEAGGLGVLATGGVHSEPVYYYSSRSPSGEPYTDINDYDQFKMQQMLANLGGGLELVLGDRDDRILGLCRFYYNADAAQTDPAEKTTEVDPDDVVANVRDTVRHVGIGTVGLSWGILGEPDGFQLAAIGQVGAGLVTVDHTEFLLVGIGPGVTYKVSRQVQLFGDVDYQMRFRHTLQHSVTAFAGARYLFD
jgi:hypothetical protein